MQIVCKKSVALPILNSFFVTDTDAIFDTIISTANSTDYRYHRKEKVYEVNKVIMKKYFDLTKKSATDTIIDQRVSTPKKPDLVADEDYSYQITAGEYMGSKENCLLFFDTGTGKTRTTIHALNYLNPRRTLIILGKSALASVWQDELKECLTDYACTYVINASLKSTKDKVKDIDDAAQVNHGAIILMNIEGARISAVQQAINRYRPEVVIIDECQVIKGTKSLQTQGVFEIESRYRWALSATPVINNPLEWYSLLKWLRVHNSTKTRFDNYYGNWEFDKYGHYVCTAYRNQEDLQQLVDFVSIRFVKNIGLPPLHEETIELEMTEEEEKIYKEIIEMKKHPFLKPKSLSNGVVIDNHASLFFYQRYFLATIKSKIEHIRQEAQNKPIIVVSMLVRTLDYLHTQLEGSQVYSGAQSPFQRAKTISGFKAGKVPILLMSLTAGGVGLTLTQSWTIEFIDAPNSQANYEQARDRVHRISQTHEVYSNKLIAKGTLDEFAWKNMDTKYGWVSAYYQGGEIETI